MKKLALIILCLLTVSAVMAIDLGTGVEFFPASRNMGLGTKTAPERLVVNGSDRSSTNPSIKFS